MFKYRIYKKHELQDIGENGELIISPKPNDTDWHPFHKVIDIDYIPIVAFESYILFEDGYPTECTKVILGDGTFDFATLKLETFEANYIAYRNSRIGNNPKE